MKTIANKTNLIFETFGGFREREKSLLQSDFTNHTETESPKSFSKAEKISKAKTGKKLVAITIRFPSELPPCPAELDQSLYRRIVSYIWSIHRRQRDFGARWVQVHSNDLRSITNDYRKYIKYLKVSGVLEMKEDFHFHKENATEYIAPFCKRYRFTPAYAYRTNKTIETAPARIYRKTSEQLELRAKPEKATATTRVLESVINNHVTIDQNFLKVGLSEHDYNWLERLNYQHLSIIEGKTGRIYSNVTYISSSARKFIRIDGKETVSVDYRSLHPFLVNSLIPEDAVTERTKWKLACDQGIYEIMMELLGSEKRDYMKEVFQIWLSGKFRKTGKSLVLKWHGFIENLFPRLAAELTNQWETGTPIQRILQSKESEVVIGKILKTCLLVGMPILTVHDCIICKKQDAEMIQEIMETVGRKAWGVLVKAEIS